MVALAKRAAAAVAVLMIVAGPTAAQVPVPPPPQVLSTADHVAIHGVIQKQIDALKGDDYASAYAVVSPSFKALYPTLDAFTRSSRRRGARYRG